MIRYPIAVPSASSHGLGDSQGSQGDGADHQKFRCASRVLRMTKTGLLHVTRFPALLLIRKALKGPEEDAEKIAK